ncbi:hypothetical protein OQA88_12152 [Cercophora sp. LCS_1]
MTAASRPPTRLSAAKSIGGKWDDRIPPSLRPLLHAYILGYASAVAPRLLTLLLQHITKLKNAGRKDEKSCRNNEPFLASLERILRGGLDPKRFPAFCAVVVGGSTLLEIPLKAAFDKAVKSLPEVARTRLSRWFASFIAAWLGLRLLQSKQSPSFTEATPVRSDSPPDVEHQTTRFAGRTLDLTFFALTRALDVIVGELWSRRRTRRMAAGKWTPLEDAVSRLADPAVFALSSGLIMSLLLTVRNPSRHRLKRALVSATRSSAFLGAFITIFYYGVCLTRTRIGPHILGKDAEARQKIDGGLPEGYGDIAPKKVRLEQAMERDSGLCRQYGSGVYMCA